MFRPPRRSRNRDRPPRGPGGRRGGDYFDEDIDALVPGEQPGYFGQGEVGEMQGPEFYPDPATGRLGPGRNHDFSLDGRGGQRGGRVPPEVEDFMNNNTNGVAWTGGNDFEIWNDSGVVGSGGRGNPFGGSVPHGQSGVRSRGGPRHGGHGRRGRGPRQGPTRMPASFEDFFGCDFDDMPPGMFDDSDFDDFEDLGGFGRGHGGSHGRPRGSGSRGEDPFGGRRGPSLGGRNGGPQRGPPGELDHDFGGNGDYNDDGDDDMDDLGDGYPVCGGYGRGYDTPGGGRIMRFPGNATLQIF